jgi:homogentisate 1,2-dioxygenase
MLERVRHGDVPDKPHTVLRGPQGALRHEECFTRRGFDGAYTILYHERRPHLSTPAARPAASFALPRETHLATLERRLFRTDDRPSAGSPLEARMPLLFNADVVLSVLAPSAADRVYFINADADELFFLREGSATLITPLGELSVAAHDYVIVPRGMLHRFELDAGQRQRWLGIECLGGVDVPRQYRNDIGQLRMDAPYSHRDFRSPRFVGPRDEGIRELVVKKSGRFFGYTLPASPLDVVGWDGTVYPLVFPISRFSPRTGEVHLPPTVHGTFAARGALICSFVPRMLDYHGEAVPCPYPHASVDVDEVIYYCDDAFSSRKGVGPGAVSLHPAGVVHGPHEGAYEGSIGQKQTSELAVMLDCFLPLQVSEAARSLEDAGYHTSF